MTLSLGLWIIGWVVLVAGFAIALIGDFGRAAMTVAVGIMLLTVAVWASLQ